MKTSKIFRILLCLLWILSCIPTVSLNAKEAPDSQASKPVIKAAYISGLVTPKVNALAQVNPKDLNINAHLGIVSAYWKDKTTGTILSSSDVFQAHHQYEIIINIVTDKSHYLPANPNDFFAMINRRPAKVSRYDITGATLSLCFGKIPADPNSISEPLSPYIPAGDTLIETSTGESTISPQPEITVEYLDVFSTDWFYDDVIYVSQRQIMNGTGSQKFSPRQNLSRSMIAVILYRFAGKPTPQGTHDYSDNIANTWFTEALKWMAEKGFASDFSNANFLPTQDLTREEMVTMLYKYAKEYGFDISCTDTLDNFKDEDDISYYAKTPMKWAVQKGIIQGTTTHLLLPKNNITRAEIAAIFHRFMELK